MYSLATINALQNEKTQEAKRLKLKPYIALCNGDENVFKCPFMGQHTPKGFKCTDNRYYVDSSGFGRESEPALTANQFLSKVKQGLAYGIYEAGQFQVYIQEYRVL